MVFVIVKHGDNKETLFNADCMIASLLDNIKHRCGLVKSMDIALCDVHGCVHHFDENLREYASTFMKEREKYVLVKREKTDENGVKYTSLLNGMRKTDPELLSKIEGGPTEVEEVLPQNTHQPLERQKSTKAQETRLSVSLAGKRRGRAVSKIS